MGSLGSFKEHRLPSIDHLVEERCPIGNIAPEAFREPHILLEDFVHLEPIDFIELLQKPVDLDEILFKLVPENLRIEQITHSNTDSRHLVGIGGTDATPCCSDAAGPLRLLRRLIDRFVIGEDQMGPFANGEVLSESDSL